MNVVAIIGQGRRSGSVARLVAEILAGAGEAGHSCKTVRLPDLTLRDCISCQLCSDTARCVLADSLDQVQQAIAWSDVIIWATPLYWSSLPPQMARVLHRIDNLLIVRRHVSLLMPRQVSGKAAILVVSTARRWPLPRLLDPAGKAISRMKDTCRRSGQKVLKTFILRASVRRPAVTTGQLDKARRLGRSLGGKSAA